MEKICYDLTFLVQLFWLIISSGIIRGYEEYSAKWSSEALPIAHPEEWKESGPDNP